MRKAPLIGRAAAHPGVREGKWILATDRGLLGHPVFTIDRTAQPVTGLEA